MRKTSWAITNNGRGSENYKEYERLSYECQNDEVWITTEMPLKVSDTPSKA